MKFLLFLFFAIIFAQDSPAYYMTANILGEVNKPGSYQFASMNEISILDLIANAGGTTRQADLRKLKILRPTGSNGTADSLIIINYEKYMLSGNRVGVPKIQPGDTLIIPVKPEGVPFWKRKTVIFGTLLLIIIPFINFG